MARDPAELAAKREVVLAFFGNVQARPFERALCGWVPDGEFARDALTVLDVLQQDGPDIHEEWDGVIERETEDFPTGEHDAAFLAAHAEDLREAIAVVIARAAIRDLAEFVVWQAIVVQLYAGRQLDQMNEPALNAPHEDA